MRRLSLVKTLCVKGRPHPQTIIQLAGFGLMALAITANPLVVGWLLSAHGRITWSVYISLIVYGEVLVAVVGLCVAVKGHALWTFVRHMTKQEAMLLGISSFLALLLGDVSCNVVFGSIYKPTKYGWTTPENSTRLRTVEDEPGQFHTVENRYFSAGFKRWGHLNSPHPKVFILGDSYTEMNYVSNGDEWYGSLEKAFAPVEWFVYGAGGYGSLQEYMVLNDYLDQIKPDLLLWQFCPNDYINNSYLWDRKYYPYNNLGVRPYLEQGHIVYKFPMPWSFLRQYSKIADLLLYIYDANMLDRTRTSPRPRALFHSDQIFDPIESPLTAPEKEALYRGTLAILRMARERARGIPFFLFSTDQSGERGEREAALCRETGITCIPGVWDYLEQQKAQGVTVEVVNNRHWNKAGNRYVGDYLVQYLRHNPVAQDVLPKPHGRP